MSVAKSLPTFLLELRSSGFSPNTTMSRKPSRLHQDIYTGVSPDWRSTSCASLGVGAYRLWSLHCRSLDLSIPIGLSEPRDGPATEAWKNEERLMNPLTTPGLHQSWWVYEHSEETLVIGQFPNLGQNTSVLGFVLISCCRDRILWEERRCIPNLGHSINGMAPGKISEGELNPDCS